MFICENKRFLILSVPVLARDITYLQHAFFANSCFNNLSNLLQETMSWCLREKFVESPKFRRRLRLLCGSPFPNICPRAGFDSIQPCCVPSSVSVSSLPLDDSDSTARNVDLYTIQQTRTSTKTSYSLPNKLPVHADSTRRDKTITRQWLRKDSSDIVGNVPECGDAGLGWYQPSPFGVC